MKYFEYLDYLYTTGSVIKTRGLETKECLGVTLEAEDYNCFSTETARPIKAIEEYLFGELAWYLSGERDIKKILPYSKFWESIRNADNTANSNYGDLVFYRQNSRGITSYDWAKQQLIKDKFTRKAIVLYNDRELFYEDNKDLICNQYQQFFIRSNKLICVVCLRSSDAIFGLTFNVPWWSLVQQQLMLELREFYPELKLGRIIANIGSGHIYENKYSLVKQMLNEQQKYHFFKLNSVLPTGRKFEWYQENLPKLFTRKF